MIDSPNTKLRTEIYKESQDLTGNKSLNIITNEITNFHFNLLQK